MHHARTSLFGAAAFWTGAALAQGALPPPDDLDLSWNGTGTLAMPVQGLDVGVSAVAMQPDGRILLAGSCQEPGDAPDNPIRTICMARLLPSGVRDLGFGPEQTGVFTFSQFPSFSPVDAWYGASPHALLRQTDGKIVVAGYTADVSTGWRAMVARLLADGTLDPSVAQPVSFEFAHNDDNPQSYILAAAQQADGKIVVIGYTIRAGAAEDDTDVAVARLRPDLTLDPSFNGTGVRTVGLELGGNNGEYGLAVAIQGDGKIVVAGAATITATDLDVLLLRFNADGTRDASFGNNGAAWFDLGRHLADVAYALRIDDADRLWIAGTRQFDGVDTDMFAARVLADGSALDTGFITNGYQTVPFDLDSRKTDGANDLLLQPDGKIVLIGSATTGNGAHFAAARLLPNGAYDSTFGTGGKLHGAFSPTLTGNEASAATFGGSGIVLAGHAGNVEEDGQFGVAMIGLDEIFANGFEPQALSHAQRVRRRAQPASSSAGFRARARRNGAHDRRDRRARTVPARSR